MKKVKPGSIIAVHMNHPENNTLKAVKMLVQYLHAKKYKFVLIDEFEIKNNKY